MKILYFTINIERLGGLARIVTDKINWLVEHDYEVSLCNIETCEVMPYYPLDSRVKVLKGNVRVTPGGFLTRCKGIACSIRPLLQIIRQEQPDVIVNAHVPLLTWWLPFFERRIPKIVEIHLGLQGLEIFDRWSMGKGLRSLHSKALRFIYGCYDRLVVLTEADYHCWRLKNAVVIPNFSNQPLRTDSPNTLRSKRIVVLARLVRQKRIDLMIRIWEKVVKVFPDWQVYVLGNGNEAQVLKQQVQEKGLSSTFFMPGSVTDLQPYMDASSILCLTSEYEGFGIVLIEAMLQGLPVMAFEYVGVHDIIDDGQTGYVIPFADVDAYVEKLKFLMSSYDERLRLRENAFKTVTKFDRAEVMCRWQRLFAEVIKK